MLCYTEVDFPETVFYRGKTVLCSTRSVSVSKCSHGEEFPVLLYHLSILNAVQIDSKSIIELFSHDGNFPFSLIFLVQLSVV